MVSVPRPYYDAMLAHVQAGFPAEACGILAFDPATQQIVHDYPTRNAAADIGDDPVTFSIIAPSDLLNIYNEIDAHDWELHAYYHSHPHSPAYPSARDVAYATNWPGVYYFIFTLMDPAAPQLRAFLVEDGVIREEVVELA